VLVAIVFVFFGQLYFLYFVVGAAVVLTGDAVHEGENSHGLTEYPARMPRLQLLHLAHARSGDKGDTANVGVIALRPEFYPVLVEQLTTERVKTHFEGIVHGDVERFELPNLEALNFLLHNALGGGGTVSLKTDAQGKVLSTAILRMEVDVSDDIARLAEAGAGS
jgi:hypothetical protein